MQIDASVARKQKNDNAVRLWFFDISTAPNIASIQPMTPPIHSATLPKAFWQGFEDVAQCGQKGHLRMPNMVASTVRI